MNTKNLLKALIAFPVLIFLIVGSVILIIAGGIAIFSSIVAFILYIFLNMIVGFIKGLKKDKNNN